MNKTIVATFSIAGVPATGLTPVIKIINVDSNSVEINNASMTEVSDGFYKYVFTSYDVESNYAIICDGGSSLTIGRYAVSGNNIVENISGGYVP